MIQAQKQNKKLVILVGTHGQPSMKMLFEQMARENTELAIKSKRFDGFIVRKNPFDLSEKTKIEGAKLDVGDAILIRWGNYIPVESNEKTITYNRADVVKNINDKGVCRKLLYEKGIPVPPTYLLDEIEQMIKSEVLLPFPLIGRPSHHGRGANFNVCNTVEEIKHAISANNCSYFSEVYPKTAEYRVHCASGKCLAVMKKPAPADPKQLAWNRALNDAPFTVVPLSDYTFDICGVALKAMDAIGLVHGAVDIMTQEGNPNFPSSVICEINTAGTINSSPYVMSKWVKYFNWLGMTNKRRQNWNYMKFKEPGSLAWKNSQFEDPDILID